MKTYYHIARVEYLPAEGIYALVYKDSYVLLTLAQGFDFIPLPVLDYDRMLEVSDSLDSPGRLFSASFSATLADDFDPSHLRRQRIVLRITDTLGIERLVGSPDFGAEITCQYSNSVAAGTLGQTLSFSAESDHPVLPIQYAAYTPPSGFVVSPSAMFLSQGDSRSAVYSISPEGLSKKKVMIRSTTQYIQAYLRGDKVYIHALREVPANITLYIPGTDLQATVWVNGGVGPGSGTWDFSSILPVFGIRYATWDGRLYNS